MVVNRSQTTLTINWRPLLLKLGGLESDRTGVLGSRLILLQSRELGIGVMLLTVSSVALRRHEELGLDVALAGVVDLQRRALGGLVFLRLGCGLGLLSSTGAG